MTNEERKEAWKSLVEANKECKTMDIKGKAYVCVPERVKAFRKMYPNGSISTEIISLENGSCIFKAEVRDDNCNLIGTGFAEERADSSYINKTSYIENCETSAVGRALGFCGYGIDQSIASAEELVNAVTNQEKKMMANADDPAADNEKKRVWAMLMRKFDKDGAIAFLKNNGVRYDAMTKGQYVTLVKELGE